jgi:hypothetical protein
MPTYTYLIEISDGDGTWMPERDDARGTETCDEAPDELARVILSNRLDDIDPDTDPGYVRVLVWAGPEEGTEADAVAVATKVPVVMVSPEDITRQGD